MIQSVRRKCEAHRNILDMDPVLIEKQLQKGPGNGNTWQAISSAFMVLLGRKSTS